MERMGVGAGELHLETVGADQMPDVIQHAADAGIGSGDGAVDPFRGEEQRAFDAIRAAQARERRAGARVVGKRAELLERRN
jgi:hypothetical protein